MSDSYFNKKLEPIKVKPKTVNELLTEMSKTAYQGRKLGEAVDVWENMVKEKDLTIAMGYAGSMSTAGQWTIVNWLMENRFIDVLVSTGANVSEDIVDAMGFGLLARQPHGQTMKNSSKTTLTDTTTFSAKKPTTARWRNSSPTSS